MLMSNAKVFISYSSKEMEIAGQVCEHLEEHNIPCWIAPRNINPGDNYATQIVHAIRDTEVLVLLASEGTNTSSHVSNEVSLAFDNKKIIIPFKIENITFTDEYLYFLGRKHWIEAHENIKLGLDKLLATVQNIIDTSLNNAPKTSGNENITVEQERAFDKSIDIAQTDFTREEIVKRIIDRASKYKNSQIRRFINSSHFDQLKEDANSFLSYVFTISRYNKPVDTDNYIDYLTNEIVGDDEAEVIKVSGLPGSGKSILMQVSFYQALLEFQNRKSRYLPFYIALGYYEVARYDNENIYEQAKDLMTKELSEYFSYLQKNQNVLPVIYIDEVREHYTGRIALENVLMDILKEHRIFKRIIAIDSGLIKNRTKIKRILPIVSERISSSFESNKIDTHDEVRTKYFIDGVLSFYGYDISAKEVFDVIQKLKYQEIDVFIIRSLANEIISPPNDFSSISDLYVKWALTELYGDEDKLFEISKSTFNYLFAKEFQIEKISFNSPQWTLIHIHHSYLSLLISYYMVREIDRCDRQESFNYDLFSIMLTTSTDMFLGSLMQENYQLQEKIYHLLLEKYEDLDAIQKCSANFWLAKLTYRNLVTGAIDFLKMKFEELKPIVKHDNTSQANYDNQFYFRSVCLSLIFFKQDDVLDDYLCLLITNDSANAIHRGAIVEYYSNQNQMAINGSYYLDTNITVGDHAIKALYRKLENALLPGSKHYPEMDLITISMLLQMRIQSNDSQKIPEISKWVSGVASSIKKYQMLPQNIKSDKIIFYIKSMYNDFLLFLNSSENGFDISQIIYNTLKNLKDIKRIQWKQKQIKDPESVSEHTYSVWLLAMLFLPNELNDESYLKREVLDMLLIHDMAEAVLGDQILSLNEPSKELREHNRIMRELMVKGSYPNMANLTYYYNIWTDYYNGININSKIARDINLIQSIYTFCEYFVRFPELFTNGDKEVWINEKGKIETGIGYSIYEKLVEKNLDFKGIFNEAIKPRERTNNKQNNISTVNQPASSEEKRTIQFKEGIRIMGYEDLKNLKVDIYAIKEEIVSIVNSVIASENNAGLENNLEMLENISENWRVLLNKDDQLVGYWVFVALQVEYFAKALTGALEEKDITLDTMEFIDFPGTYKGYLLLSGTKPEARTASLVQTLYQSLAIHFQNLAEKGIYFDEICAVGESPMGISALRKLGMIEIGKHVFGGKVFACNMTEIKNNPYFSSYKELADLYSRYFQVQN